VVLALRGGAFSLDTQAAVLFVLAGQRQVEAAAQISAKLEGERWSTSRSLLDARR